MQNSATEFLTPRNIDVTSHNSTHAKIVLEPLERGFGHTLGNALDPQTGAIRGSPEKLGVNYTMKLQAVDVDPLQTRTEVMSWTFDVEQNPGNPAALAARAPRSSRSRRAALVTARRPCHRALARRARVVALSINK